MLKIDIITLFPETFAGPLSSSIVKRACDLNLAQINCIDLRKYTDDVHRTVDDRPFGGGPGMVMMIEPLAKAITALKTEKTKVILTSPSGVPFTQKHAEPLAKEGHIIFVCGHYEGVDQRFIDLFVDAEYSIGDYVLTNGNLPAMVMTDCLIRLLPGALGCAESAEEESFSNGLLEYAQYTRPRDYCGRCVPDILLSGDHAKIAQYRHEDALERTRLRRPDLYQVFNSSK